MHDLPSISVHAGNYSIERQGWPVRCPSCGHEWLERAIPMRGNVEVVTQPMHIAAACARCGQRLTINGAFGEVVE